jgi:hypothetical protein
VAGHAIGAFVLIDDGEIDDVALLRREARLLGDAPERALGLERGRALGENAVQVGHEAPSLLDAIQDLGRGRRRGGGVVKREAIDQVRFPCWNTELRPQDRLPRRAAAGMSGRYDSFPRGMSVEDEEASDRRCMINKGGDRDNHGSRVAPDLLLSDSTFASEEHRPLEERLLRSMTSF